MENEAVSNTQIFYFLRAGVGAILFFIGLPYFIAGIKGHGKFYEKAIPQNAVDLMGEIGVRVVLCFLGLTFMVGGVVFAVRSVMTGLAS